MYPAMGDWIMKGNHSLLNAAGGLLPSIDDMKGASL